MIMICLFSWPDPPWDVFLLCSWHYAQHPSIPTFFNSIESQTNWCFLLANWLSTSRQRVPSVSIFNRVVWRDFTLKVPILNFRFSTEIKSIYSSMYIKKLMKQLFLVGHFTTKRASSFEYIQLVCELFWYLHCRRLKWFPSPLSLFLHHTHTITQWWEVCVVLVAVRRGSCRRAAPFRPPGLYSWCQPWPLACLSHLVPPLLSRGPSETCQWARKDPAGQSPLPLLCPPNEAECRLVGPTDQCHAWLRSHPAGQQRYQSRPEPAHRAAQSESDAPDVDSGRQGFF